MDLQCSTTCMPAKPGAVSLSMFLMPAVWSVPPHLTSSPTLFTIYINITTHLTQQTDISWYWPKPGGTDQTSSTIFSSSLSHQISKIKVDDLQHVSTSVQYNSFLSQTKSENTPKAILARSARNKRVLNYILCAAPNMLYNCPYRVDKSTSSQEGDKSDLFRYWCFVEFIKYFCTFAQLLFAFI